MKRILSIVFALALVLAFSLVATTPVAAATLNVPSVTYPTIQAAITAASPGDTIVVAAGTYTENPLLNKSVNIHGGSPKPVLNGALSFAGAITGITIRDIVIQRASAPLMDAGYGGPVFNGVQFISMDFIETGTWTSPNIGGKNPINFGWGYPSSVAGAGVLFKDCTMSNNGAQNGGTFMQWEAVGGGPTTFDNVTVNGNGNQTEINIYSGANVTITDCHTTNNAYFYLSGLTNLTLENNTFAGFGTYVNGVNGANIRNNVFQDTRGLRFTAAWGPTQNYNVAVDCNTFSNMAENAIRISGYTSSPGPDTAFLDVHYNSFLNIGGCAVNNTFATYFTVDAESNWWGNATGPYHPTQNPGGTGYCVTDGVDFTPWLGDTQAPTKSTATSTGTGTAYFSPEQGNIAGLAAVPTPSSPPVQFPHGMFNFTICCLNPGDTVILNVTLPAPVPVGTKWYKYNGGAWDALPIGDDDGDNFITVALTDGDSIEDEDSIPGQITDQGGPGGGGAGAVGWATYPVSKVRVLLPWIALVAAIALAAGLLMLRHRQTTT